ncbi:hypothetical protein [Novosphingobium sp. JCM 18896]|uniref:hypothetical protein n=1 Tax=Novosphingobium sp. JCM 18896 TaxID=2989731 RepID=UPI00222242CD|nr:hypothetical protein [Novosphingobium sp. JCM 18896]MCW1431807.1 hypothetical protein [Novosphingobium sp. JCM 18896]
MLARRLAIVGAALSLAGPALAQSVPELTDLVGARAAGGETQLEARGYVFVTTNTVRDTKWSFWWKERTRQCVQVATSNGRYDAIQSVPEANCRQTAATLPASPDNRPSPADPGYGDRYGPSITLICFGGGSAPAAQYQSGYAYNSRSHRFEPQFGTTLGREGFASDLQIEIWHGRGRIRPEGKLISPIHSGGDNGWWTIENLVVTPDRITGQYRMNGLNKPRIDIDRRSGRISIRAATNFTGRCDAGNWRGGGGF